MYKTILFIFILIFINYTVFAQAAKTEIGIETDNDAYLAKSSDKYYTDGLFLFYRHALKVNSYGILQNKVLGFELGQKIFTPHTANIADYEGIERVSEIDRPFAAYLYLGATLNLLYKNENSLKLNVQAGTVGPNAFGKQMQSFVHKALGFYHPRGWLYQVDNDFEINLSAQYNRLLARYSRIEFSLTGTANLGNGFTGAGLGTMVRIGSFNKLYNSISTNSTVINRIDAQNHQRMELFFYYKPHLNFIAYDATVQGSLFGSKKDNSLEVILKPNQFVLVNQLGLAYSGERFGIIAEAIFNTREVKTMHKAHQWGAVSFLWHILPTRVLAPNLANRRSLPFN